VGDVSKPEGDTGSATVGFILKLSQASNQTVTAQFATADWTAKAGSDYIAKSGSVSFVPGVTQRTISVAILGDTLSEPNEVFLLELSNPTNATIANSVAVGTILDNDHPPNDAFGVAQVISGRSGTVYGTNVGATKQAGEPNHSWDENPGGASVWYNWTAPATATVVFDTLGSNFDTLLAAYTGSAIDALTPQGKDSSYDRYPGNSEIVFSVAAGQTYHIAVDGSRDGTVVAKGNIQLDWHINELEAPYGAVANPNGVSGQLKVSYTEEPDMGSSVPEFITKFRATCRYPEQPNRYSEDTSRPFGPIVVTNMVNGLSYTCKVQEYNSAGAGPESNAATGRVGAPAAPGSVTNAKGASVGQIKVTWTASATPTYIPITGYTVTCTASGTSKTAQVGNVLATTIGGLDHTKTYTCKVAGKNKFGTGPFKSASSGTSPR
jgi:hypothetical protein